MGARFEIEREVQKIYIAYYGRPADPEGQEFWAQLLEGNGGDLSTIIDAFGNSEEFNTQYGGFSGSELIHNLFQQLFGRDADDEGLQFYLGLLESGAKSLASISLDILNGAQNDDFVIVGNKLSYVEEFTLKIKVQNKDYDSEIAIRTPPDEAERKAQRWKVAAQGGSRPRLS